MLFVHAHHYHLLYNESNKGNYQKVETLLKAGTSPNIAISNGWTPVMIAAAEGHKDVVKLLVNGGADVNVANKHGRTPIMFAARYGFTDIVEILAKAGAKMDICSDGLSPLMVASAGGHLETVKSLIRLGANVNLTGMNGDDALQFAVHRGHYDIAKTLLENGALPNRKNENGILPLQLAIYQNNIAMTKLLLDMGADPNLTTVLKEIPSAMPVATGQSKSIIEEIKSGKVKISSLMVATQHGHFEIVKELLDKGADINFINTIGGSALSYSNTFNHKDIENYLIQKGATQ